MRNTPVSGMHVATLPAAAHVPENVATTASEPAKEPSRQVRRQNARRGEKAIQKHMNETVLKKNRKRR